MITHNKKEVCTIRRGAPVCYGARVQASSSTRHSGEVAGTLSFVSPKWQVRSDNRLTLATFGYGSTGTSSDFELSGLAYDKSGNIKALARRDQSGTLIDNLSYTYANGTDKISEVVDGAASTPSLDWDAESATYQYDANGNLTSRSDKISNISYDWRNLPIDFDLTDGHEIVDNYNAGGQRIIKELKGGALQFYVKDGDKTLAVIASDTLDHFNLFGNGLFGRYEPATGAHRYYLTDNLGSTRIVTDNNGSILQTFDYYPFGLLMPGRSGGSGSTMEKFTGKELDDEPVGSGLNLYYFGARYYDGAIGQWLSVDPKTKKYPMWSPYNYGLDNPLRFIDPNGNAPCCGYPTFVNWGNNFTHFLTAKINTAAKTTVESTAKLSDQVSKASMKTSKVGLSIAGAGAAMTIAFPEAPEVGASVMGFGSGLAGFGMTVGTGADVVSAVTKSIDAKKYGGSKNAAHLQRIKVGFDFLLNTTLNWIVPVTVRSEMQSAIMSTGKEATGVMSIEIINHQIDKHK